MAITREQKEAQVKELTEKLSSASSVILAHYIGLSVTEVSDLRRKLKERKAEMKVAKKTLMKLAAAQAGLPDLPEDVLKGPVSLIFSFGDPLSGAQIAFKYSKDHEQVELIGGVYDDKLLSKEEAITLAKMPGRTELLALFACMLRSPLYQFAALCNSPLTGFARALNELAEKGGTTAVGSGAVESAEQTEHAKEAGEEKEESPPNPSPNPIP